MASPVKPAVGMGMYVEINGTMLQGGSWKRNRKPGEIEMPTSGLDPDEDGNYEMPHDTGFVKTTITLTAPFDTAAPFHDAPYDIRAGIDVSARFGMTSNLLTPEALYRVMDTTDQNEATANGKGEWECTLMPSVSATEDDTFPGYFNENS